MAAEYKVYDRLRKKWFSEPILGERWLRAVYTDRGQKLTGWLLFRAAVMSRCLGRYADAKWSARRIPEVIQNLGIDPREFRDQPESFRTFNEFFTRHLRAGARPFDSSPSACCSPADSRVLAFQQLPDMARFPVKGLQFTLEQLLTGATADEISAFRQGAVVICRLSPADYHRFHFPTAGTVLRQWQVPGRFDSVHPVALACGKPIFMQNIRQVNLLKLELFGNAAFIEVGAFGVARIVHTHAGGKFAKMDEKGYFQFGGSTLILLFQPGRIKLSQDLLEMTANGFETLVRVGETIGTCES